MDLLEEIPESRRVTRRAVDIACDLITERWDRPVQSHCVDLSPQGMRLETTFPLDVEDMVVVSLRPPHAVDELTLFARVASVVRAPRFLETGRIVVGLEFLAPDDDDLVILYEALRGLPPPLPAWSRPAGPPPSQDRISYS
jgi:hypothetical protein